MDMDLVSKIEQELQIPKKTIEIPISSRVYAQLEKETDEQDRIQVFRQIARNIDERTEETKRDVDRMLVSHKQLQTFSGNLTKIEEPLNDKLFSLRQQRKALATENALTSNKILNDLAIFEDLEKTRKEFTATPTPVLNMDSLIQIKKDKEGTEREQLEQVVEKKVKEGVKEYVEGLMGKKPKQPAQHGPPPGPPAK